MGEDQPQSGMRAGIFIGIAMAAIVLLVVAAITLLGTAVPGQPAPKTAARPAATRPAPAEPAPPVEPLVLRDIAPDSARAINAAIPFANSPHPAAAPFVLAAAPQDRERALYCLTSAAWYEAGNDPDGQRAVIQVVLNRLRHPAYPKTVCGVVFQGAERTTGCQFTFTCDGALARPAPPSLWARARTVAEEALRGQVFAQVGLATSYHTDWVVPYWSSSLEKIAELHTHLFFRWPGGWGRPAAFTGLYAGGERIAVRSAFLAALPRFAEATDAVEGAPAGPAATDAPPRGSSVGFTDPAAAEFALALDPAASPASYAGIAARMCRGRPVCTVIGWTDPARVPRERPIHKAALRTAAFLYRRNERSGTEQTHWNCRQLAAADPARCMPGTERATAG